MAKVAYRSQFSYGFAGQACVLRPQYSIGASGAATLVSGTGMGVESITRNSAGNYTILLSGSFFQLLDLRMAIESGASAPAAPSLNIVSQAVGTVAAPAIIIQMRDIAGAAADPASGEILRLSIDLNRSSTGC